MHHSNLTPHTPTRTLAATALLAVGLTMGGQAASAAPEPAASASTAASSPAEQLQHEASALERKQHWLGAVTQWRACLRRAPEGSDLQRKALEHLRDLAGIAWRVRVESKSPKPLVVGKTVLAIPYEVTDG